MGGKTRRVTLIFMKKLSKKRGEKGGTDEGDRNRNEGLLKEDPQITVEEETTVCAPPCTHQY